MGIRNSMNSFVSRPAARVVEGPVREMIEEVLATRSFARPGEVHALSERVAALESTSGLTDRIEALEALNTTLEKKLNMAMGALQVATAQIADLRRSADEARSTARQANQLATSANSTAEALADGITALEDQVAGLGASDAPAPRLEVLDGTVGSITTAVQSGELDDQLEALAAAERSGKNRKGALAAFERRLGEL